MSDKLSRAEVEVSAATGVHPNDEGGHGNRCSCRTLAAALHCKPETIRLSFCRGVLMKHWSMQCNHFSRVEPQAADTTEKWRDIGPMDPVKAILIVNE